jgi:hypothetical protein
MLTSSVVSLSGRLCCCVCAFLFFVFWNSPDRNWDIRLPGVQALKPVGNQTILEQHRQRLARVKQTVIEETPVEAPK